MVTQRYGRGRPRRAPTEACLLAGILVGVAGLVAGCSGADDGSLTTTAGSSGVPAGTARTSAGTTPAASSAAAVAPPGRPGEKIPAATVVQLLDRSLQGRLGAGVHTSIKGRIGAQGALGRTGVGKIAGTREALLTQVTLSEEGRSLTVLSTPKSLYLKGLMVVDGKPWARTTAAGDAASAATVGGLYSSVTEIADPRHLPETWKDLDTSTVAGPTSVQGVPVTSYRAELKPDVAFGLMPTELRTAQLKAAFQRLDSVQTLSMDASGRPVQVVTEVTGQIVADGVRQPIHQVTSVRYSGWGKPVTITVPGPSTSYDLLKATGMK